MAPVQMPSPASRRALERLLRLGGAFAWPHRVRDLKCDGPRVEEEGIHEVAVGQKAPFQLHHLLSGYSSESKRAVELCVCVYHINQLFSFRDIPRNPKVEVLPEVLGLQLLQDRRKARLLVVQEWHKPWKAENAAAKSFDTSWNTCSCSSRKVKLVATSERKLGITGAMRSNRRNLASDAFFSSISVPPPLYLERLRRSSYV
eukprot:scaffold6672_cov286-Pinguiococcus_pyrenoidosus.AAC.6